MVEPIADAPGAWYPDELPQKYIPLAKSDLGGNINKQLTRKGDLHADIRNSEQDVDIKVTYKKDGKEQTRIVRVSK